MAACRERPVAAWGIPAIPVEAKLGLIPLMPPAPANAARFWKIKTNNQNKFILLTTSIWREKIARVTELWRKRKQNWVLFHLCHQRLLMQPDSEKIKTNLLMTVNNLDLTRRNRTEPTFGGNGSLGMKNQNKSVDNLDLTRKKQTVRNFGGNGSLSMKNQNKSDNNCQQPRFDEK